MIIGVAKEIRSGENCAALTPAGGAALRAEGHDVLVEKGCGQGCGFTDEHYRGAGARIIENKAALFDQAELLVKIRPPFAEECALLHAGQILFSRLELLDSPARTRALLERRVIGIAHEGVLDAAEERPLTAPLRELAGRLAVQEGARLLARQYGGKGIVLGGIPGLEPARVVVVGGGAAGLGAAKAALAAGAAVTVLDRSPKRLAALRGILGDRAAVVLAISPAIEDWAARADLLIGAVPLAGPRAPKLVSERTVRAMEPGSVVVDLALAQGGIVATCDRLSSPGMTALLRYGVVHCAVADLAASFPRAAALALTNAALPYILQIAGRGCRRACLDDPGLAAGVRTAAGHIACRATAEALRLPWLPPAEALAGATP